MPCFSYLRMYVKPDKSTPVANDNQPLYRAYFTFKGQTITKGFNSYFEAVEWCCVRFEHLGEKRERFAQAEVKRSRRVCLGNAENSATKAAAVWIC